MNWEELTAPQFSEAVDRCEGVCLLPLGVLEKHGDHLPLGTDLYIARQIAQRAASLEPAVVFPPYFFTQIYEARHTPGTVGIESRVMYELLQTVCNEIARNGLKKIILVNGHGGNEFFLPHFIRLQLESPSDYIVYLPKPQGWSKDEAFRRQWAEMREAEGRDEHAGESESSSMLAIRPDLVDEGAVRPGEGRDRERLAHLRAADIYTGIGWYASFPDHYSGQAEHATAEKGRFILEHRVGALVDVIRVVKRDEQSLALQAEFFARL